MLLKDLITKLLRKEGHKIHIHTEKNRTTLYIILGAAKFH